MRASQVLADNFTTWGVTHVFGIPGKSISPLMLDIDSQGIQFVLSRHESGAGFAASGYAMFRDTIGIAIVTSGPGGTNALTSAAQAKAFHLPVLFITGQPSASESGKPLGQDSTQFGTDLVEMFRPVTKFSARVDRPDVLHLYLKHALEKAFTGPCGPVHLCLPFDVLLDDIEPFTIPLPQIPKVVSADVSNVLPLFNRATRPVLLLGKGVHSAKAYEEVRLLAEHWGIPVITTPGGKGVFPSTHELALGNFGLGGSDEAADYLRSGTDLMIAVGTKISDMSLSGLTVKEYPQQIVHFDYDPTFSGKAIPVPTVFVPGDARLNLARLLELANATPKTHSPLKVHRDASIHASTDDDGLSAISAVKALRRALPQDAILFGDDGSHTFYAIRHYDVYEPGTFIFDDVFGAMGHPIGYSIGAKIAAPERTIVCLTGDGCLMMHGTELSTAVNEEAAVIFVVFNNGRLDMVDKGISHHTGRTVGSIYQHPLNAAMFGKSMGMQTSVCHSESDIETAVRQALAANEPTLIEVMVNPHEIPPILSRSLTIPI
ncbi:thiamine pyrophosphate-binding protein [Alicyclobacillus acidoterrestris]|uniref:Thiamine pyrophosphate-binding protein n=1 Tax=Alicyclobacillus acidoterrestris (strain ATCC 49025 / DSM 3922 / CIP 106132 / NCIMB 13137 / GD3B) TaxID=1356854 RepID=A0A9E6ZPQ2_ALIAG|nr:thiamine pyrophosphate-binding protein [Alicyclobacillus acidoterrestris]UNO49574.1 thiamine pyrophosphate-binding protein [Alicyclobacillus acidoterrestris]